MFAVGASFSQGVVRVIGLIGRRCSGVLIESFVTVMTAGLLESLVLANSNAMMMAIIIHRFAEKDAVPGVVFSDHACE